MSNGGVKRILDYKLNRYVCYLIVQNAVLRKKVVALGQTYFATQIRKEKIYSKLTEDEKKFHQRSLTKKTIHLIKRLKRLLFSEHTKK